MRTKRSSALGLDSFASAKVMAPSGSQASSYATQDVLTVARHVMRPDVESLHAHTCRSTRMRVHGFL